MRQSLQYIFVEVSIMDNIYNLSPVLRVKDLAEILSVSHNTAYELVRSGQIRSIRIGRSYRIPRESVIEFLSKNS